jgi:hypothetical protein
VITASVVDSGGTGDSDTVTITVVDGNAPPAAPSGLDAKRAGRGVGELSWTDNAANEDGFDVQREKRSGKSWGGTTLVGTTAADETTFVDAPGRGKWRYRVRAFNAAGESAWSDWAYVNL